jgi:hypothetical protein
MRFSRESFYRRQTGRSCAAFSHENQRPAKALPGVGTAYETQDLTDKKKARLREPSVTWEVVQINPDQADLDQADLA